MVNKEIIRIMKITWITFFPSLCMMIFITSWYEREFMLFLLSGIIFGISWVILAYKFSMLNRSTLSNNTDNKVKK